MHRELALSALLVPISVQVVPAYAEDYLTAAQAQQVLFPQAQHFEEKLITFSEEQRDTIKERAGTRQRHKRQQVWRAERNGELLGWMMVDNVIGKHEFITYALAVSPGGEVMGLEIMSYRETHGDEVRQADWRSQFFGKGLEDQLRLGRDVSNISGATLSCRNITDGVRRLLVQWDMLLREA